MPKRLSSFIPCIRIVSIQIFQKVLFILILLDIQTLNSEPPPVRFSLSKSQSKTQQLLTSIQLEISVFLSCICISIVWYFHRKLFTFFWFSNSYFTKTKGFISSISVGIETMLDVERFSIEDLSTCVPCISALTVGNFQEKLFFRSVYKFVFLSHYMFQFLHHQLSLKSTNCRRLLRWQNVDFFRCIRVVIVQTSQKKPLNKINFRRSNTSSFVTHNCRLNFFYQSPNKKPYCCQNILDIKVVDLVLCIAILIFRYSK